MTEFTGEEDKLIKEALGFALMIRARRRQVIAPAMRTAKARRR